MKEKRESALKEIKRLTTQIDQLKLNNKKSDIIIENSYSQIPDFNINNNNNSGSNNINGDNHNNNFNRNFKELQSKSSVDKTKTNISSIDTSQMLKNYTNKSFNKLIIEGNYLCLIKKELEGLYKDFIPLMPWDAEKKQQVLFIKLERKMNDCIQKAQDLIDTIEDIG